MLAAFEKDVMGRTKGDKDGKGDSDETKRNSESVRSEATGSGFLTRAVFSQLLAPEPSGTKLGAAKVSTSASSAACAFAVFPRGVFHPLPRPSGSGAGGKSSKASKRV